MNPTLRNIIAVLTGLILGNLVNMGLIMLSSSIIPPPSGYDNTSIEGLKATMYLLEPKHFIFPFLAHAFGTLVAAFIASKIAANNQLKLSIVIGVLFLLAGISMVAMIPSPLWFSIIDLVGAYLPMAYVGWKLSGK